MSPRGSSQGGRDASCSLPVPYSRGSPLTLPGSGPQNWRSGIGYFQPQSYESVEAPAEWVASVKSGDTVLAMSHRAPERVSCIPGQKIGPEIHG